MAEDTEPQVTEEDETSEAPASESESEEYIRLSKKDLFKELDRVSREDPKFSHAIRTLGGRATKSELTRVQAELEETNAKLAQLQYEQGRAQYQNIEPEDLAERLRTDPQFAANYAQAMSRQQPQQTLTREQIEARAELEQIKDELLAAGAPEGWGPSLDAYIQRGQFGQTVPAILRNVQKWADQQIAERSWEPKPEPRKQEEPVEEEETPPAPPRENPRLAEKTDTTPAARGGAGTGSRRSRTSYKTKAEATVAFYNGDISTQEMRRIDASALPEF